MGRGWHPFGRDGECSHEESLVVSVSGITRVLCEQCGHVEVRGAESPVESTDRSRFARTSERGGRHAVSPSDGQQR